MNNTEHVDNTERVNTTKAATEERNMENTNGGLKIVKVRDVVAKLVDDRDCSIVLDDEEVNSMIEEFMSEDFIDKEGNKHSYSSTGCADTVIRVLDGHLEKFKEVMKHISPQQLQEAKEHIHNAIQKDPFLYVSLNNVGIDLNNFENYLGSVEVLTIERRRVYNVYEIKKEK
jgi:hypothetical protein